MLTYETLRWWFDVERRVAVQKSHGHQYVLDDICFKPTGKACVTQSITQYFGGDFNALQPIYAYSIHIELHEYMTGNL